MIKSVFSALGPNVKEVKVTGNAQLAKARLAFIHFDGEYEATMAMTKFGEMGNILGGAKVTCFYARPQNPDEEALAQAKAKALEEKIEENAANALSGVNAGMWSDYMKFMKEQGT